MKKARDFAPRGHSRAVRGCDLSRCVPVQTSVINQFTMQKELSPTGKEITVHVDPVYWIFNQDRIDKASMLALKDWFDSNHDFSKPVDNSSLTDDQIRQFVKPRSVTEIGDKYLYRKYLESRFAKVRDKFVKDADAQRFYKSLEYKPDKSD